MAVIDSQGKLVSDAAVGIGTAILKNTQQSIAIAVLQVASCKRQKYA
jgi:hypothetical protein